MKGYVATVRLTDKAGAVLAEVGQPCDKVPDSSMAWLIEQQLVVPVLKGASDGEV